MLHHSPALPLRFVDTVEGVASGGPPPLPTLPLLLRLTRLDLCSGVVVVLTSVVALLLVGVLMLSRCRLSGSRGSRGLEEGEGDGGGRECRCGRGYENRLVALGGSESSTRDASSESGANLFSLPSCPLDPPLTPHHNLQS